MEKWAKNSRWVAGAGSLLAADDLGVGSKNGLLANAVLAEQPRFVDPQRRFLGPDGSEPSADAHVYGRPIEASRRVRAGLFVGGERVVEADSEALKFRIAGSTAPRQEG